MDNSSFSYQYSARRNREVENIRNKYLPKKISKIENLKRLDFKVQSAGQMQGLTVGVLGVLIFGIGMCFGLDVLRGPEWLALVFGIIGVAIMAPAYPIYRYISNKTRKELVPEILRISDEIMESK